VPSSSVQERNSVNARLWRSSLGESGFEGGNQKSEILVDEEVMTNLLVPKQLQLSIGEQMKGIYGVVQTRDQRDSIKYDTRLRFCD